MKYDENTGVWYYEQGITIETMKINESSKENIIKECAMEGRLGKKGFLYK